jgi:hypothetical protein
MEYGARSADDVLERMATVLHARSFWTLLPRVERAAAAGDERAAQVSTSS